MCCIFNLEGFKMNKGANIILFGVIGILIFVLISGIAVKILEPQAVKDAVERTTTQTQVVDGVTYNLTGNGESPAQAAQDVHDNFMLIKYIIGIFAFVALLVIVFFGLRSLVSPSGKYG